MATLLPVGKQQILDSNGAPLSGGKVYTYVPGTTTDKNTYQDSGETTLNTNPVVLDSLGSALIYGDGSYRFLVTDSSGNTIWDVTSDEYASAISVQNGTYIWGGTSGGSANAQTLTFTGLIPDAYTAGQCFRFIVGVSNTGAATLNVNSLGAKNIYKPSASGPVAVASGDLFLGNIAAVIYDGTQFQLIRGF